MKSAINAKLSVLMFLQFFIWGAWYTSIAVYMTAQGMGSLTHWPFTVNPVAAIVAPFFLGLVADRFFATEKVLAVLHLLGSAVLLAVPSLAAQPTAFILGLLVYNLCYMPTLGLANSLAFHHLDDQEKQFPRIRVFGTLGWIVAGLAVSFVLDKLVGTTAEGTSAPLLTAGVASLLLGFFCFTLPHTPPSAKGRQVSFGSILGLDAFRQLGSGPFYVFLLSSFLICIPLAAYYNFTQLFLGAVGLTSVAATQTLGQVSEVGFMLLMPVFFARLGVKWMLVVGMGAWVLRYALFALGAPDQVQWMVFAGIALHGICYDFFFVTGQIYVDKKSSPAVRGQAQGMLVLVTYGAGMLIGAQIAGRVYNGFLGSATALTLAQWQSFWWIPAAFALGVLGLFAALFRDKSVDGK
ncbi:MFS transporter [Oleiharenicola lentus]|uniref:MFS transporter n=1 Tax=Oleiharenicola lentus TaxID=2508720 RepID=A0A4Q1CAR4_9BACT|nr:MFS transporter [Oleiharenicola lentus]RXK56183.1 MFS transporter [Oleiharenicola lentus]